MKTWTIEAEVRCIGVYQVEAETEEEAQKKWDEWRGDDDVVFCHYSEENISHLISIEED